ncbi:unnamed protein product [Ceratitis capitata]|uniref:(Mediterranean fruit fly) hypothetical protein n=1 Tax=Ceratitis capitata TaxID=7213 RepID=A0A811USQ4_CERCA|nr:unnamed protein product [Ceratitis capitata]
MNSAVYRRSAVALAGGTTGQGTTGDSCGGLACSGCRSHAASGSIIIPHNPADVSINKKNQPQTMRERGSVAETRLNQQASEDMAISETIRRRLMETQVQLGSLYPTRSSGVNGLNEDARAIFPAKRAIADTILYFIEFIHIPTLLTTHRVFQKALVRRLLEAR